MTLHRVTPRSLYFCSSPPPPPPDVFLPNMHGMKGTPQAPPQNTVTSLNFLPPPASLLPPFPVHSKKFLAKPKLSIENGPRFLHPINDVQHTVEV